MVTATAISLSAEMGKLRIMDPDAMALLPHLSWLTAAVCMLLGAMILRGKLRILLVGGLLLLTGSGFTGFVVLPALELPLLPVVVEVARAPAYGGDLVGLCISTPRHPARVSICREIRLFSGIHWRRQLFQTGPAEAVVFHRRGNNHYRCEFAPYGPGQQAQPRLVYLHR